jgi:hypothetical protein
MAKTADLTVLVGTDPNTDESVVIVHCPKDGATVRYGRRVPYEPEDAKRLAKEFDHRH